MRKIVISLMWITTLFVAIGWGQTTEDAVRILEYQTGFGARALGMGGAYTGVADDYSAVYWNPAGLAQMRKMEFWTGLSHVRFSNDINFNGYPSSASQNATKFNSIGLVFPIPTYRGSLVFALGYQKVRDFEYANNFQGISSAGTDRLSFYLDNTNTLYDFWGKNVQKTEYVTDQGNINQWTAAGAIDISPNISLGTSLLYWTGSSDYLLDFKQLDIYNNFTVYPANFNDYLENQKLLSKYSSFSLKVGGFFHLKNRGRLGIVIDLPQTINVTEDYSNSSSLSFDDGEVIDFGTSDGTFEYDVKMPFRFSAGLSSGFGPVLLSTAIKYTDWTQLKFAVPSNASLDSSYSALLDQNREFNLNYRETIRFNVGGEVGLPFYDSQLRLGFIYDPTPLKNMKSENNRKYYTFGYGMLLDKVFKIDLAYIRGNWKQTTYDNLAPLGTSEDITFQKLLLTFSYRF